MGDASGELAGMAVGGAYAGLFAAPQYGLIVEGSMGLGTPTPAHKFHIRNAGETVMAIESTGTGARKWGIVVNPAFIRANELRHQQGDPSRLAALGFAPRYRLEETLAWMLTGP